MTVAEKILTNPTVLSGVKFYPKNLARSLGIPRPSVKQVLRELKEDGLMSVDDIGRWSRVNRHWIHKARLNDSKGLRRARGELFKG